MDIDTGTGGGDAGFAQPLLAWLADVGAGIDAAVECSALSLPLDQYESVLRQLASNEARIASLRLTLTWRAELNEVKKLTVAQRCRCGGEGGGGSVPARQRSGA